jgi:hypothetical protein
MDQLYTFGASIEKTNSPCIDYSTNCLVIGLTYDRICLKQVGRVDSLSVCRINYLSCQCRGVQLYLDWHRLGLKTCFRTLNTDCRTAARV